MIDFVVEVIFECLLESLFGGSRAAARRNGRWILGTILGGAVGAAWGIHLRELPHWPRLRG